MGMDYVGFPVNMEKEDSFKLKTGFSEARKYVREVCFPKLRDQGLIGPVTNLIPSRIEINEPNRFRMRKMLTDKIRLYVELEEDSHGRVHVVVNTRWRIVRLVTATTALVVGTCGCGLLIAVPFSLWRTNVWHALHEKVVAVLRTDLA